MLKNLLLTNSINIAMVIRLFIEIFIKIIASLTHILTIRLKAESKGGVEQMSKERHEGYVVGSKRVGESGIVWKVRVKDKDSPYDGQKLAVISTYKNFELAQGLNINFIIGTIDDPKGQKVLRAVDVRPDTLDENHKKEKVRG